MNKIKFLVVFFSLGWSIYMGSFLFEALYKIQSKNLQNLQQLQNETKATRSQQNAPNS